MNQCLSEPQTFGLLAPLIPSPVYPIYSPGEVSTAELSEITEQEKREKPGKQRDVGSKVAPL